MGLARLGRHELEIRLEHVLPVQPFDLRVRIDCDEQRAAVRVDFFGREAAPQHVKACILVDDSDLRQVGEALLVVDQPRYHILEEVHVR